MRGRPLVIAWQESVEELEARLGRERNGHRRARIQALLMLRRGSPIDEVSRAVGVDYRTVQRWVAWYRDGGLESVVRRTPGHAAPGRPSLLSRAQLDALLAQVDAGAFRTVWDAVRWVSREFGVTYTYTGMHAVLSRNDAQERRGTGRGSSAAALPIDFPLSPASGVAVAGSSESERS